MNQKSNSTFSIPNIITFFRLLLIPVFVLAFFEERYDLALICLAVSGVSDVADGYIARHFDMVTELGKLLDPVADKLTQGTVMVCLAFRNPVMWILFGLLAFKELVMSLWGWIGLRRTGHMISARWYGKACTVVIFASMVALVLLPGLPRTAVNAIVGVTGGAIVMTILLYSRWYVRYLRENAEQEPRMVREHGAASANVSVAFSALVLVVLLVCAAVAFIYRKEITLEAIESITPRNLWLAGLLFMALYAAKSLSTVVYVKLLYIAAGVIFPLPAALLVGIAGSVVEFVIPYVIGRTCGRQTAELVVERWPRLRRISELRTRSNFWFSALVRAAGVFPQDPVSIYCGSRRMPFRAFLWGSLLGTLPTLLIATIFGTEIKVPGSPGFILSIVLFVVVQLGAIVGFGLWNRNHQTLSASGAEKEVCDDESAQ